MGGPHDGRAARYAVAQGAAGISEGNLSDEDRDKYYENMASATDRVVAFDGGSMRLRCRLREVR